MATLALLFGVALWAGAQNALAGGGSFITLPALILSGLDARTANIASTLALFPGQVATGWAGRGTARAPAGLSLKTLIIISLSGGVVGAGLLLLTPSRFFARLLPWLILLATALFARGALTRATARVSSEMGPRLALVLQFLISVYGGYFGGGIGFLMLAFLTAAGLAIRPAAATKNVLAAVMNAAAVLIFVFTPRIPWVRVAVLSAGALLGGYGGVLLLRRVDERVIRVFVVVLGLCLTLGLFLRGPAA